MSKCGANDCHCVTSIVDLCVFVRVDSTAEPPTKLVVGTHVDDARVHHSDRAVLQWFYDRWCARFGAQVSVWDSREAPPGAAALLAWFRSELLDEPNGSWYRRIESRISGPDPVSGRWPGP